MTAMVRDSSVAERGAHIPDVVGSIPTPATTSPPALTPEQEAAALRFDPWEDDRDSDARTLSDRFIVTRKDASCAVCLEAIPAGSRVRAQRQVSHDEGKAMTFRFCVACCAAMAWTRLDESCESFNTMAARYSIGIENSAKQMAVTQ